MELYRDDNDLTAELRALRPEPRQEFAAELDERAAAGFPRRSASASSPLSSLYARLRAVPPRRLALSMGATALATIAVATVIVAASEPQDDSSSPAQLSSVERISPPPAPLHSSAGSGSTSSSPASAKPSSEESAEYEAAAKSFDGSGPYATNAGRREVERSAEMVLGADPDQVADDAAAVFDAVHAADGIVLSSSVAGGAPGAAGARFDLLIPAAKLGDALADFSAIDTVVSRHEATDDITAPTVRVGEHLRDSQAKVDGLLVQLAGTDSDEERAEVEAELRAERRHAASLRSRATKLDRRANLSRVSLRIETGGGASSSDQGGGWGIGDALGDGGHILTIAAGVTIVGLAILAPLALIALLVWLANRARIRRGRERALA